MLRSLVSRTTSVKPSVFAMSSSARYSSSPSSSTINIAPPGTANVESFPAQREAGIQFAKEGNWWVDCLVEAPVAWGEQGELFNSKWGKRRELPGWTNELTSSLSFACTMDQILITMSSKFDAKDAISFVESSDFSSLRTQ